MLVQTGHAAEILVDMLQLTTSDCNCCISIMLALYCVKSLQDILSPNSLITPWMAPPFQRQTQVTG
jgi:hypothetical protein